jgi:hypothetical protein
MVSDDEEINYGCEQECGNCRSLMNLSFTRQWSVNGAPAWIDDAYTCGCGYARIVPRRW